MIHIVADKSDVPMIRQNLRRAFFAGAMLTLFASFNSHAVPILEFSPSDSTAAVGDSFSVDVLATDFVDLFGFQILMTYDPAILNPNAITEGNFLSDVGTTDFFADFAAGDILIFNGLFEIGATGSGSLATINFTGLAAGFSPLTFSDFFLFDSEGQEIAALSRNGSATVITPVPEPNSLALVVIGLLALGYAFRSTSRPVDANAR